MSCNGMPFFSSNFLLQTEEDEHPQIQHQHQPQHHQPPNSLNPLLTSCCPHNFHGIASLLGKRSMSFSGIDHLCNDVMNGEEDVSDDGLSQGGEKKRRLSIDQVKTLERTFEQGNKLEPERKMQLARALGLQPRQIAIWFQNRRARWKTKQLEKDYSILKRHFDAVQAENDSLKTENQKLHAEIISLRSRSFHPELLNLNKETIIDQGSCSTRSDNSSDIQLDISRTSAIESTPNIPISIPLFPTSSTHHTSPSVPTTAAQLFFTTPSSRPDHHHRMMTHNSQRSDHYHSTTNTNNSNNPSQHVKEESFGNMFCGMEDQTGGLWPWLEQQHFN